MTADDRMVTAKQLREKVREDNRLSPQQQDDLYNVLIQYQQNLTKGQENAPVLNTTSN
jgi:hypothetical protein